jgi:hypothetical protein
MKGESMRIFSMHCFVVVFILLFSPGVNAGVYSDDLSRCLVESSTSSDKLALVRWVFTSISLHPAVRSIASVSPKQVDDSNREMAALTVKLVTVTCKNETIKAMKYEGESALKTSFGVLGQVAMKELFSNPDVAKGLAGLEKYMDTEKIKKELGPVN